MCYEARRCTIRGATLYYKVLPGTTWYCTILRGTALYYEVLRCSTRCYAVQLPARPGGPYPIFAWAHLWAWRISGALPETLPNPPARVKTPIPCRTSFVRAIDIVIAVASLIIANIGGRFAAPLFPTDIRQAAHIQFFLSGPCSPGSYPAHLKTARELSANSLGVAFLIGRRSFGSTPYDTVFSSCRRFTLILSVR